MKASREKSSTDKRRWVVRQKSNYGSTYFRIIDQESGDDKPLMTLTQRAWAEGVVRELNKDPKVQPGVRVRLTEAAGFGSFGGSEPDDLYHVTEDRYGAGDVGVLKQPHPNQAPRGCVGWWYIEVAAKSGEPRKLWVGVWPGGFEVLS